MFKNMKMKLNMIFIKKIDFKDGEFILGPWKIYVLCKINF